METNPPVSAGAISPTIFALSTLPMLFTALRTKDLSSYSLSNILFANLGSIGHSLDVFSLLADPIWLRPSFYLVATSLMRSCYLRYQHHSPGRPQPGARQYPRKIPHLGPARAY
jgi:hypothetical protein